ncbi:MAG TPA: LamG domain-containing protein [Steroidobacteraceae bacterium]|nr:LamG domain-containing protein [Steroidobacteraceae bacterium]
MNGLPLIHRAKRLLQVATVVTFVAALAACGAGAPTTTNPVTSVATAQSYSGPAPQDADVQAFMTNLWANINSSNRCGACHSQTGGQSPEFARTDNVNLAYQAANTVVNLSQPSQSLMVQKVSGGHNCWLASPQACGATLTVWIQNWAGTTSSGSAQIQLVAPPEISVGSSKSFPASASLYQSTVYPIVTQWCSRCHSSAAVSPQQPYFADPDVSIAYSAAQPKIVLADANPANSNPPAPCTISGDGNSATTTCQSRFVQRLVQDHHNCWSDCAQNGQTMLNAIVTMANQIPLTPVDPSLVVSKALTLYDGTVASGQNRYTDAQIALYMFQTGTGNIAYDTSGVEPELDLTLDGNVTWVQGWGINIGAGGKAQASTTASSKLYNMITSTGEFSIEAWINPNNQTQANAYIVSYSGGPNQRNMTLAQNAFQYEGLVRSSVTSTNGMPPLATNANNEVAQAALQHVVLTYDPVNGRKLYVNGVYTGDVDPSGGGAIANWDSTFALVLGSETSGSNAWSGVVNMLAIHNRALTPAQVMQNFNAGVGEQYYLLFDVSSLTGVSQSYIMMLASLNDNYSYMLTNPTFISLDPSAAPNNIPIQSIRIGINGQEVPVGQTYIPLNTTVTASAYNSKTGQQLSNVGAVVPIGNGPAYDQFFLTFAQIGSHSHTYTNPTVTAPAPIPGPTEPDLGVRTFERVNQSMAKVTGVSPLNTNASSTYQSVQQSLPAIPNFSAYSSSNQTAFAQLAAAYCSAMATDPTLGPAFFGSGYNSNNPGSWVASNTSQVINAIYNNLVGTNNGTPLATQPTPAQVQTELTNLIDTLDTGAALTQSGETGILATAACTAVLSSASMLVN